MRTKLGLIFKVKIFSSILCDPIVLTVVKRDKNKLFGYLNADSRKTYFLPLDGL